MSDDYLWDRSGPPDPEIARLEALLQPLGQPQSVLSPTVRLKPDPTYATVRLKPDPTYTECAGARLRPTCWSWGQQLRIG